MTPEMLCPPSAEHLRPKRAHYLTRLDHVPQLSPQDRRELGAVTSHFAFRISDHYLRLVNWNDPADPIRRLIIPRLDELDGDDQLDPCNEASNTILPGLQRKYPDTAVLLCSEVCAGFCRYCFRKRLFMEGNHEAARDLTAAYKYIASEPEITNVLLTGGDPLLLSTRRLSAILAALRLIPHVQIIRIGSKVPAFDPWRILEDFRLQVALATYSTPQRRIYLMTHFDHPRELTSHAVEAVDRMIRSGVICANQCPIIRGVNDDPAVLSELFRRLSWMGCPPYYVFQCRPTAGNRPYRVPIVEGWNIFREALRRGAGLARRARFVMSHATGKIEILAVDRERIYVRYHRAKEARLRGQLLIYKRDNQACWLDELEPVEPASLHLSAESLYEMSEGSDALK